MRETCLICVKKHIGQAIVLMDECEIGYTAHRWLSVAHLSEAESETLKLYPELTSVIRRYKKQIEKGGNPELLHIIEYIMENYDNVEIKDTNSSVYLGENLNELPRFKKDKDGNYISLKK